MSHNPISLKSDFEFSGTPRQYSEHIADNLVMTIKTGDNRLDPKRLHSDFKVTLGYGAMPAVQAQMIEAINRANEQKRPLALTLECTL